MDCWLSLLLSGSSEGAIGSVWFSVKLEWYRKHVKWCSGGRFMKFGVSSTFVITQVFGAYSSWLFFVIIQGIDLRTAEDIWPAWGSKSCPKRYLLRRIVLELCPSKLFGRSMSFPKAFIKKVSLAQSLGRSDARSLGGSIARSLERSNARSIARSIDRSLDRSTKFWRSSFPCWSPSNTLVIP